MKYLRVALSLMGAVLLLVTAVGHWTALAKYESAPPRTWERFDPKLADKLRSFSDLMEAAKYDLSVGSSEREIMDVLYEKVTQRFTHKDARHNFYSNWLLYLAGKIHPALSHIYDPNLLVRGGHSLLCDQSSYVLLRLALANGIKARHVGLDGHVVMEAWYDSDWHLYDPDLEVIPVDSAGHVLGVEELALNQQLLKKYYGPHGFVEIVSSRENNTYVSYPEGSRFEWKANVLAYLEKSAEILKFVFPIIMTAMGLRLANRQSNKADLGRARPAPPDR